MTTPSWIPSAAGAAGSIIGNSLWQNPSKAAMPYLSDIEKKLSPYYQPYISAGQTALPMLMQQYGGLISNPAAFINTLGQGYQQSPGYRFNVDEATRSANQAAAAGGMVGSPQEQQQLAQTVTGLANQDYNNWMNNAMGMYQTGLGGMGGINQMGFDASGQLAQSLKDMLMAQAGLAYQGANAANQRSGGLLGSITGAIGGLF